MKQKYNDALRLLAKRWWMIVVIAMLATFSLSLYMGLGQGVWFDEGYSLLLAHSSYADLVSLAGVDAHPPLYYALLKVWGDTFGWSEFALRSLSALFAAGAVGAGALLVRSLFGVRIALVVLPFLVFAPFLLRYGYEIRMYALVSFIVVLATWVLVRALRVGSSWKWWALYAVLVAVSMYTLYMSVVVWLAHVAWLLYVTKPRLKTIHRQPYIAAYAGALLLFLPQIPTLLHQLANPAQPPMDSVTLNQIVNILGLLFFYSTGSLINAWQSIILVVFLVLFGVLFYKAWQAADRRTKNGILLFSLLIVVALLFYVGMSLPPFKPRFNERYVAHIAPFIYALIGIIVALGWKAGYKRIAAVTGSLGLVILILGVLQLQHVGNFNFQRSQEIVGKQVVQLYGCENTVYISDGPYVYIDMYYELTGCDHRLYSSYVPAYHGGYAPLHKTKLQLTTTDIQAPRIVLIRYDKASEMVVPDERYRLVQQTEIDKTSLDIYQLQPLP